VCTFQEEKAADYQQFHNVRAWLPGTGGSRDPAKLHLEIILKDIPVLTATVSDAPGCLDPWLTSFAEVRL